MVQTRPALVPRPIPWAPEIPIWVSLLVILGTLVVTTIASLMSDKSKKDPAKQ